VVLDTKPRRSSSDLVLLMLGDCRSCRWFGEWRMLQSKMG